MAPRGGGQHRRVGLQLLGGAARDVGWHRALRQARRYAQGGPLLLAAAETPGPQPLPKGFWARFEDLARLCYSDLQPSGYAGYGVQCLEAAAWCALYAEDAEQAIVDVVNLGGESDTWGRSPAGRWGFTGAWRRCRRTGSGGSTSGARPSFQAAKKGRTSENRGSPP